MAGDDLAAVVVQGAREILDNYNILNSRAEILWIRDLVLTELSVKGIGRENYFPDDDAEAVKILQYRWINSIYCEEIPFRL